MTDATFIINRSRVIGLAIPAALLLLLAALIFVPESSTPSTTPLYLQATSPQAAATPDIAQWRDTLLARPLFNTSRRPVQATGLTTDATLPRLSAIIVIGGVRSAIFSNGAAFGQILREGGQIAGYRVNTIAPDQVDLTGPRGSLTLRPQYENAGPPTATAPPPPLNPATPRQLDDDSD